MGLIRFLLIILGIYLFFRLFTTIIFPWVVKRWLQRFQKNFYNQNPHLRREEQGKEGEVSIKKPAVDLSDEIPKDLGEYIDYEDVKE